MIISEDYTLFGIIRNFLFRKVLTAETNDEEVRPTEIKTSTDVMKLKLTELISSPGHDKYFRSYPDSVRSFIKAIRKRGVKAFITEEYPYSGKKNIIINVIGNKCYVVDGNRHLVSILLADPANRDLTLGELDWMRCGLFRIWFGGIEGSNTSPYDVYIPMEVCTDKIDGVSIVHDYFKPGHPLTQCISATVPFDDERFNEDDRGRPLGDTAAALEELEELCGSFAE